MTRLIYRPIQTWPGTPTSPRRPAPFEASWTDTLELLDRELRALRVDEAILQVDSPSERDFRLDGGLRSNANPRSPAVILSFEAPRHGRLSYPCDTFDRRSYRFRLSGWQANVRAIALGLEALREVERYGIANTGQQYTGWKQLGAGIAMAPAEMTVDEAARFIVQHAGLPPLGPGDTPWAEIIIEDRKGLTAAYRQAAKRLHPDAGGDPADFRRLNEAHDLIAGQR